jgi:hypothetical protein
MEARAQADAKLERLIRRDKSRRILLIDIETRPNLAHVWDLFNQNVGLEQLIESKEMICYAAQWAGSPKMVFASTFHDGADAMVGSVHALLNEADAVVHYNGIRFDVPHINREILLRDLFPPSPYKQIDLYKVTRRRFKFASNKLAHLAEELKIGQKIKHEGHSLWVACMAGDAKAWERMRRYCKQDVRLTNRLYLRLLPWITSHALGPALLGPACPACGSPNLRADGVWAAASRTYPQFQCTDCGHWSRSVASSASAQIVSITA